MMLQEDIETDNLIECFSILENNKNICLEFNYKDNDFGKFNFQYIHITGIIDFPEQVIHNKLYNLIKDRNNILYANIFLVGRFFKKHYNERIYFGKTPLGRNLIKFYIDINHATIEQDIKYLVNCLEQKYLIIEKQHDFK